MAIALTETATFDSQVVVPEDFVDNETAASLVPAFQSLADRTRGLKPAYDWTTAGTAISPSGTLTVNGGHGITTDGDVSAVNLNLSDSVNAPNHASVFGAIQTFTGSGGSGNALIEGNLTVALQAALNDVLVSGTFTFLGSGRIVRPLVTVSTNTAAQLGHDYYVTGASGTVTITLPTSGMIAGDTIEVRNGQTAQSVAVNGPALICNLLSPDGVTTYPTTPPIPFPGDPTGIFKYTGTAWILWNRPLEYAGG